MLSLCRFCSAATERSLEQRVCVAWLVEELREIGFSASVRDAPGRPIAVGHDRGSRGPSVLFCGQYNAPHAGLSSEQRDGGITPSASIGTASPCSADQSTQLMAFVEACRAWKAVGGQLPTSVSVLVTGEEGLGSVMLTSFLSMYADELKAEIGLAPAVRVPRCSVPKINGMLRGLCCEEFSIFAADRDQLSRPPNGVAADPALILTRIVRDLHDPSGYVAIPGFYSGIEGPLRPPHESPCDSPGLTRALDQGVPEDHPGLIDAISVWPTCEIDSISSSRSDGGAGPTIFLRAFAKLSFHLVWDQDPNTVRRAFRDFARARVPPEFQIEFTPGTSVRPVRFAINHPAFRKARNALTREWGRQAAFACGQAAPVIHALREALGMEVIVTAFPERPDRSSRETAQLAEYRVGIHSWARILDALAE